GHDARRPRPCGCLSLGYFSLGKQREVTRSPGWRAEKHTDVKRFSRYTNRAKSYEPPPLDINFVPPTHQQQPHPHPTQKPKNTTPTPNPFNPPLPDVRFPKQNPTRASHGRPHPTQHLRHAMHRRLSRQARCKTERWHRGRAGNL